MCLNLPRTAFLPCRILGDTERDNFVRRRDRLFALCTPDEQQQLLTLARWYDTQENSRGQRALRHLVADLEGLLMQGAADVLFGVVHFLRMVPVQVGLDAQRAPLKQALERLAAASAEDTRVPAARRFAAIQRCALWSHDVTGFMHDVRDLGRHTWQQLLALLQEDTTAAIQVVDAHWKPRTSPRLFDQLSLHDDAELAYRLAIALRPHRPDVAAALLGDAIHTASFQREKVRGDEATLTALQKLMDGACAQLAEWTLTQDALGVDAALEALQKLFQFGDPAQPYWHGLLQRAMALVRNLPTGEHPHLVSTLARVTFYSPEGDPLGASALALLEALARGMTADAAEAFEERSRLGHFFLFTLPLLEDKGRNGRNRRVPAQPAHKLLHAVDRVVDDLMARVATEMPERVLRKRMLLAQQLAHETLIRKHHRLLREEFEGLARVYPRDAGRMMKRLIKYCAYSQSADDMYKRELCAESFDLLLPVLARISPPDAAVARKGIGWNLREHGYDMDD